MCVWVGGGRVMWLCNSIHIGTYDGYGKNTFVATVGL